MVSSDSKTRGARLPELSRNERIEMAAQTLHSAWTSGQVIPDLPADCKPRTIDEGHEVQSALVETLGYEVGGWKLAASSPAALRATKLSGPNYGRLFLKSILASPAELESVAFHAPDMEPEFAFRLATDLPPRLESYGTEEIAAAVGSAHLAIETANSRYSDHTIVGFPGVIADVAGSGALVVGPEIAEWRDLDLAKVPVSLKFDGEVVAPGFEGEARCDPLDVLIWLANELSRRGIGLNSGETVTTGTSAKPTRAVAGQVVTADFEGLGSVEVRLV